MLKLQLHVIIRPRGGDFLYSDLEFQVMKRDIEIAKDLGADGVVFGILKSDGNIDEDRISELVRISSPLAITFHRAFDVAENPFSAIDKLIDLGIDRVLTSGQKRSANEGREMIKELIDHANGKIVVMPGGGITADNFIQLRESTMASEFHLSGKSKVNSQMNYRKSDVSMGGNSESSEFEWYETNYEKVKNIVDKKYST